jgi:hypothetical protein
VLGRGVHEILALREARIEDTRWGDDCGLAGSFSLLFTMLYRGFAGVEESEELQSLLPLLPSVQNFFAHFCLSVSRAFDSWFRAIHRPRASSHFAVPEWDNSFSF